MVKFPTTISRLCTGILLIKYCQAPGQGLDQPGPGLGQPGHEMAKPKSTFQGGGSWSPPPCQVGLTYGWKNRKQPSGPLELDLEASNLVCI